LRRVASREFHFDALSSGATSQTTEILVYQRALTLIAAFLAAHFAWSAMSAEDISAPNAVLAKIAAITPARLVGLRLVLQRYAHEATARQTPEHSMQSRRVDLVDSDVLWRRRGQLALEASWSP
jgi:hypothetical protein